jgi:hypothetical protein
MGAFYWERHPDGPFVTLLAVAATYCSPDACGGDYDHLISRAGNPILAMRRSAHSQPSCGKRSPTLASCPAVSCPQPPDTTTER